MAPIELGLTAAAVDPDQNLDKQTSQDDYRTGYFGLDIFTYMCLERHIETLLLLRLTEANRLILVVVYQLLGLLAEAAGGM